ncbi:transposase [Stenotrophomonas acidaminiphila]|jgi:putative transposase
MPRRARLVLPHVPLHIIQRGENRAAIFIDDEDRQHYRRLLREACLENDIAVHAFVLMDNRVPPLLTPSRPEALAVAMCAVGQSYVQFFNCRHGRTGTDPLITLHSTYLALGATWEEQAFEYGRWLRAGMKDEEISTIRNYIAKERAFGCTRPEAMVEKALGRPAGCRNGGRSRSQSV